MDRTCAAAAPSNTAAQSIIAARTSRAGRTYPGNKVAATRRLMSLMAATPSAEPALTAGMTAGTRGEDLAELLLD